ncbi:MAG TPA: copper resistance protein CopC [Actinomycetes bacterium]
MRRAAVVVLLAAGWLLATPPGAGAHALLRDSDPASGASLDQAPRAVVITFTEQPDPGLSSVRVVDQSGREAGTSKAAPVPGKPSQLRVPLRDGLPNGVYSVAWRVLSRADGHVTTGSFSFGVGVDAGQVPSAQAGTATSAPPPSLLGVAGRWLLYWGLALLVGAAATGFAVFGGRLPAGLARRGRGGGPQPVLLVAFGLGVVGLAGIVVAEWTSADTSFGSLASSAVGHSLERQAAALAAVGLALVAFEARPRARWSLALVGLAAAAAMLVHAASGHAARESSFRWFNLLVQWLHLVAVGVWVGGLAWLLLGTRGQREAGARAAGDHAGPSGSPVVDRGGSGAAAVKPEASVAVADPVPERSERVEAVKRFSRLAGYTVAVIAATGALRAIDEVGGWGRLLDTGFGRVIDLKVLLFACLLAIGAMNRQRLVPALAAGAGRLAVLRRNVRMELGLAAVVLVAAGLLTELPPGGTGGTRPAAPPSVEASGNDYATTVRVKLVATPGTPGPNGFRATVVDYDSGEPVPAQRVQLQFSLPSRPDLGESTLELERGGDGAWSGRGGPLVAQGRWSVTALVQVPGSAVTVPMQLQTRVPPQQVQVSRVPGQPTVYTISLAAGGTLQSYADPGSAGRNQLHFTFFAADGNEQPVGKLEATARPPSGDPVRLKILRLGAGHFAANADLTAGRWTFAVDAEPRGGSPASASFQQDIDK